MLPHLSVAQMLTLLAHIKAAHFFLLKLSCNVALVCLNGFTILFLLLNMKSLIPLKNAPLLRMSAYKASVHMCYFG